jgi:CHASE2 domain-containing sensor protein
METKKIVQISFLILLIVTILELIIGIVVTFMPELLISRSFPLYTDKPWNDFLTGNPMTGNYILIKERMIGVQVLATCMCGLFVILNAFRKVEKWVWYCLLVFTVIGWGSMLIEGITFNNSPVIIVSVVGLVLVTTGLIISAKTFLTDKKE